MNGRATGIAIHAITTNPIETTAPAFVPGTGRLPKARFCGAVRWRPPKFWNIHHLIVAAAFFAFSFLLFFPVSLLLFPSIF
jgi:hypothetical protein